MIDLSGLREALDGELLGPGSPGYEAARRPAGAAYRDVRPRLVAVKKAYDPGRLFGFPQSV